MKDKKKEDRSIKMLYTVAILIGLTAFLFFMYPTLSDAWNKYVSSKLIATYTEAVVEKESVSRIDEEIKKAREYNEKLYENGKNNISEYAQRQIKNEKDEEYESILGEDGMMGYVDIPKIYEKIPIKHYTSDEVLKDSVGHLYGTSFPVGGKNTHSVISAHNALVTAKLFTDLDKLVLEDKFAIHIGGNNINYEVDQIEVVLPDEIDYLSIEEGEDYLTLLTCTPYGVNTHRLLVRGKRIADDVIIEKENTSRVIEVVNAPVFMFALTGFAILLSGILIFIVWRKSKKQRK